MSNYESLINGYFLFNDKVYLGIKYQIITGKLVIHTTTRVICILKEHFEDRISFDGITDRMKLRLQSSVEEKE